VLVISFCATVYRATRGLATAAGRLFSRLSSLLRAFDSSYLIVAS